ncbi:hypothetical protein HUO13_13085 [Saccharopolyspora erythraea]|uniref:hypothetical protein n=1 Tax=Saccharopolyspora erythraea TaxID=1836 RepID=UPI001BA6682F|nr:hypothetical protein [Saccharopolyspora erythraea]QUH01625.1 hypothetical protein HUO13_13085 [Saccharopolyspora erythraea]
MDDSLMWEVRAVPDRMPELLDWVDRTALPLLRNASAADVYRSTEDRVVVVAHFPGEPVFLPDPPRELIARPAHQWTFERIRRVNG